MELSSDFPDSIQSRIQFFVGTSGQKQYIWQLALENGGSSQNEDYVL
jgi:hypothetical protein